MKTVKYLQSQKGCYWDDRNRSHIKSEQSDDKISEIPRHMASKIAKQIWNEKSNILSLNKLNYLPDDEQVMAVKMAFKSDK